MLTIEQNERLTQVGPGTPGGKLLRHYWHPIAPLSDLDENPVKKVRLLGEDLVLFRDRSGRLGLVDHRCPHRRVSLEYGVPEEEGLRCAYHGWMFDTAGRCVEQPAERAAGFREQVGIKAYPVEALGGLVFAYLGPQPAPLLPRLDLLVWDNVVRHIGITTLPCNWLQCVENALDPVHVEWLHGRYMDYVWERQGKPIVARNRARHVKIGFDEFSQGIVKRRVMEGQSEADENWTVGHPLVFPNILRSNGTYQWRVPLDDTHTLHITYNGYRTGMPVKGQERGPVYEIPLEDEYGRVMTEVLLVQDFMAWVGQGEIAERHLEHLGQSDVGIAMMRRMLEEQMARVEQGKDPSIGIYRDPEANRCIMFAEELHAYNGRDHVPESERVQFGWAFERFNPLRSEIVEFLRESERRVAQGELVPPGHATLPVPVGASHRQVFMLPETAS